MSKEIDQEFTATSRQNLKLQGGSSSASATEGPLGAATSMSADASLPSHSDSLGHRFQSLINGVGAEIERIKAELRAQLTPSQGEKPSAQGRGKTTAQSAMPSAAVGSSTVNAGTAQDKDVLTARLDELQRQNAALERRVDAKTAEVSLLERQIGALEERDRQSLVQSERLMAERDSAQADVRMLFDRMAERLSVFSRNANMREAMARDEAAAERLEMQQGRVRDMLHAEQASTRALMLAEVVRLAKAMPERASAALMLAKLDDEDGAQGRASAPLASPVEFLAARGVGAMALAIDPSFEIDSAMQWTHAEFITAAYRWLLGRDADANGVATYSARLGRGTLRQTVLVDIAQSAEALARLDGGFMANGGSDQDFLHAAYLLMLGRAGDRAGYAYYADQLANGTARSTILLDMAQSDEAQRTQQPAAAALRAIHLVNQKGYRFRQSIAHWRPGYAAIRRHVSYSARIAAIDCLAARRNCDALAQLDAIQAQVEERARAAYRLGRKQALASLPFASGMNAGSGAAAVPGAIVPGKTESVLVRLSRRAGARSAAQIIQAIRAEIKDLELN